MKKSHLTLKKLEQKVCQLFSVVLGVLNNILKVYQNLTTEKVLFSRWRSRWPKKCVIKFELIIILGWDWMKNIDLIFHNRLFTLRKAYIYFG